MFPADFFETVNKERNIKTGDINQRKQHNNHVSKPSNKFAEIAKLKYGRGPSSPNYMEQIEMIPEVEDDKFNTIYDKNNPSASKDESSSFKNSKTNRFQFNDDLLFNDVRSQGHSKENLIKDISKNDQQISKAQEEVKNPIKLNFQRKPSSKTANTINDDETIQKNCSYQLPIRSSTKTYDNIDIRNVGPLSPSRNLETRGNTKSNDNEILFSDSETVYKRKNTGIESKHKHGGPNSQNKVKLPVIKSSRTNFESKIDKRELSNIFDACQDLKKDPEIKEKFNELMSKIVDLKNVINSKSNNRFKISSAPTQIAKSNMVSKPMSERSNVFANNVENITFSRFPNFNTKGKKEAANNCNQTINKLQWNTRKNSNSNLIQVNKPKSSNQNFGQENQLFNNFQLEKKILNKKASQK